MLYRCSETKIWGHDVWWPSLMLCFVRRYIRHAPDYLTITFPNPIIASIFPIISHMKFPLHAEWFVNADEFHMKQEETQVVAITQQSSVHIVEASSLPTSSSCMSNNYNMLKILNFLCYKIIYNYSIFNFVWYNLFRESYSSWHC